MACTAELSVLRKKLRPYQAATSQRFREALTDTGRGQIVLATGLGKTVVMAETVADLLRDGAVGVGRLLVLGHARGMANQCHQSFWCQMPKWPTIHQ